jgi:hypothetical protein
MESSSSAHGCVSLPALDKECLAYTRAERLVQVGRAELSIIPSVQATRESTPIPSVRARNARRHATHALLRDGHDEPHPYFMWFP